MIQHIVDALSLGGLYALLALGIALVFGVMGLVNFAYGELIMIGGYTILVVSGAGVLPVMATLLIAVVFAALLMERLAFRPARGVDPATLMVISFALSVGLQSAAILIAGARPKSVNVLDALLQPVDLLGTRVDLLSIVTIALTAAIVIALTVFLKRTVLGLRLRAAAEDFTMTQLLGVRTNRIFATAFGVSGVLAAVAALILTVQSGTLSPAMGAQPVLIAFVATVIGGIGNLPGAALGGLLLGTATVVLQIVLPADLAPYREAILFFFVILVLLVRPGGILGSKALVERV